MNKIIFIIFLNILSILSCSDNKLTNTIEENNTIIATGDLQIPCQEWGGCLHI